MSHSSSYVVWSVLLLLWAPSVAQEEPEPREFRAVVSAVRLNSELIAQGKKLDDDVTVTLPAIFFEPSLVISDVRDFQSHARDEVNLVVGYTRANLEGQASDILAFWAPDERADKSELLDDPEIFKNNRELHLRNPGLTILGLVFQDSTVTVLLKRSNMVLGINLVSAEDRFFLTDHPSDDLEIAIVEASLNKR